MLERATQARLRRVLIGLVGALGVLLVVERAEGAYPGANGKVAFETNRDGNEEI